MYDTPKACHFTASFQGQTLPPLHIDGLRSRWNVARKLGHLDFLNLSREELAFIQRYLTEVNKHSNIRVYLNPAFTHPTR